jgi:hypothetical protein
MVGEGVNRYGVMVVLFLSMVRGSAPVLVDAQLAVQRRFIRHKQKGGLGGGAIF